MTGIAKRTRLVVALCMLVTSAAVTGLAAPAVAEPRDQFVFTYFAEPDLVNVVGMRFYCHGQAQGWGAVSIYKTVELNDFC
jgi:hypothetical protein